MTNTIQKAPRPISITIICIFGFVGALITFPLMFSSAAQQIGDWYPPYLGFSTIVGTSCMVGLWMMKKWAVYVYTGFVAINQIALFLMGFWNVFALLMPAVIIFFAFKNISKMS